MALSYVAQSARGSATRRFRSPGWTVHDVTERFMTRWRGDPDPSHVAAVDAYWVSAAEHGLNASTFTGQGHRVHRGRRGRRDVRGDRAMSGPLHGGAPARVLPMLAEVERTGTRRAGQGVLDRRERLMGFGHRVYRAEDPRARVLRRTCQD